LTPGTECSTVDILGGKMGLREDAIKAYKDKKEANEAKQAAEKREYVERRITRVKEAICAAFALGECPPLAITHNDTSYWPEVVFEVEGIVFDYDLGGDWLRVKVSCPKCEGEWMRQFRVSVDRNGVRDLSWLGNELSMPADSDRHFCPADQPPPAPRPKSIPPQTVTYRIDSVEHTLLDSIREYVNDAIEQEREGR